MTTDPAAPTLLSVMNQANWEDRYGEVRAALVAAPYGSDPAEVAVTALFGACPERLRIGADPLPEYGEVLREVERVFGRSAADSLAGGVEA